MKEKIKGNDKDLKLLEKDLELKDEIIKNNEINNKLNNEVNLMKI